MLLTHIERGISEHPTVIHKNLLKNGVYYTEIGLCLSISLSLSTCIGMN